MTHRDSLQITLAGIELRVILLVITHALAAGLGFVAGIYLLPILTAPPSPSMAEVTAQAARATYTGQFRRDLEGSDLLHWGEGTVSVGLTSITFVGKLAPGRTTSCTCHPSSSRPRRISRA
jgi:hypothetical protein